QQQPFHQQPSAMNQAPRPSTPPPAPRPSTPPPAPRTPAPAPQPAAPAIPPMRIPPLPNPLNKGQKVPLDPQHSGFTKVKLGFGWNVSDNRCDIDASAFLLGANGKVPGDDWFVFYGQDVSPDRSVRFYSNSAGEDREYIEIDLTKVNPDIKRIVFVLTIHEAYEQRLNFSMIQDAYMRILDPQNQVVYSYRMQELYANVTSMTIGEIYLHNGQWKVNPVGNGVDQDLAGQCAIYGVQIC
ncbi:MAG TPA: tellurium resistance protein TerD, partial [Ruminococcus sp.]|nr:tellurium resistance protein TerD [Ruminococcus sp.]